jgi:hypothetical protein
LQFLEKVEFEFIANELNQIGQQKLLYKNKNTSLIWNKINVNFLNSIFQNIYLVFASFELFFSVIAI